MISRIDLRGAGPGQLSRTALAGVLPRAVTDVEAAATVIRPVCDDVRRRGAQAVREYTVRFDHVDLATTLVPQTALDEALDALDPDVQRALEEAARRARTVHQAQLPAETPVHPAGGLTVTSRFIPVNRAGVYVPGGLVAYPSSVVMNIVPAQVAGVGAIAVASPPQADHGGLPHPSVLAACALLGIREVHAAGGAQALAMFAYGTEDCAPVDVITGPGNVYVAAAKRVLRGVVGTDGENGPTEVAVIADDTADAAYVAADLIAQAEHDELAACLLITTDPNLADHVDRELDQKVQATRHRERVTHGSAESIRVSSRRRPRRGAGRQRRVGPRTPGDPGPGPGQAGRAGGQRRGGLRRPVRPGFPGGLPGRLEPRAADRRDRAAHQRPVHLAVRPAGQRHRMRRSGAGRRRAADRRPGRRRGPGRARRSRAYPRAPGKRARVMAAAPPPVRDDLKDLHPYGAPQIDVPVRLNTNENPYPPSPALQRAVTDAVAQAAATLNRYPDRDAVELRKDLADYLGHGLTARHMWAANGSNEVIQQLLQAFGGPGRRALGFEPGYSMHPLIARVTCTTWIDVDRDEDFGLDPERAARAIKDAQPSLVFLTSPNNPTGTAAPIEVIEAICDAAPGLVVIDEAYAEFAREGTPSALTLLPRYPGLVVTRTMSKAFAMAGARVGYLAAAPEVVEKLLLVRLPYHLSAVTQAVARAALALAAEPLATVTSLRAERDGLVRWLRARGLRVADSDANFVLFGTFSARRDVWQGLLDRGVLVREVGPPRWLRVTVGTPEDMAAFRAALREVLSEVLGL